MKLHYPLVSRSAILISLISIFLLGSFTVQAAPSATISGTTNVCLNSANQPITFTGTGGTAPYTFTYKINGGTNQTVTTSSGNTVSVSQLTTSAGTFTYQLVSVSDKTGASAAVTGTATVTVGSPDARLSSNGVPQNYSGIDGFSKCLPPATLTAVIGFSDASTTVATNTNYKINWGDGTPDYNGPTFSALAHTYGVGFWTLTLTVTGAGGCISSKIYKIFVGSNPAVALGSPGNTSVCVGEQLTFPIPGTSSNPPGTVYTVRFNDGSPAQVFTHPAPASITHVFTKPSCDTISSDGSTVYHNAFKAWIVATNSCGTSSAAIVPIYVSSPPIADFYRSDTVACTNSTIGFGNNSFGSSEASETGCKSAAKIVWQVSPATGWSATYGNLGADFGSPNNPADWISGTDSIRIKFTTPGKYSITMRVGNTCGMDVITKNVCIEVPIVPTFTVDKSFGCTPLTVTTTNTTNTANMCAIPAYTWKVTYVASNCGTTAGWIYQSGNQTSASPAFKFTNSGTYTISVTSTNSCGTQTASQVIEVMQPPTATIDVIADACGTASIKPTATISACGPTGLLTYNWSFPGGTPSTSTSATPGPISYPTPGNYTVSLQISNGCGTPPVATRSFIVKTLPTVSNTPLSKTICSGTATGGLTISSTPTGATYSWTASATGGVTGFLSSGTGNITSRTLSLPANATTPGTVTYTITPTLNGCVGPTAAYVITVNPTPKITSTFIDYAVCVGGPSPSYTVVSTGIGAASYQWYSNTANSTTGGTAISGATSATYSPPTSSKGVLYYYCNVNYATSTCSTINSTPVRVEVFDQPTISTQPVASQTICLGSSTIPALSVSYSGGTGAASYKWYKSATNSNSGGTVIIGATSPTYTPPASDFTTIGSDYYYCIVTLGGVGCNSVTSNVAEVKVVDDPAVSLSISTQNICQNTIPTNIVATVSGGSGANNIQWYSNSSNSNTGGTLIAGATSATYTPPTNIAGTKYYYCVVSQTGVNCQGTSATTAVIVTTTPSFTAQPANDAVCINGTPNTLSITHTSGVGTASYQWYSNSSNTTAGATVITGATSTSYVPLTTVAGTTYYFCVVSFSGGGCQQITSNIAKVDVNNLPVVSTHPQPMQTICVGGSIPALTVAYTGGAGTPTYTWYANNINSNTGGSVVGANSPSYTPPVFTSVGSNNYYYCTITTSGNGCTSTIRSNVAQVVVVADPTVSVLPLTQTICQKSTPTQLTATAGGGVATAYQYQWYVNSANSNSGGTAISGATNATYTPVTLSQGVTYYYCEVTQTNGPGCFAISNPVEVNVKPVPTFVDQPLSSEVCIGGAPNKMTVSYKDGVGTASYQWYVNSVRDSISGSAITGATTNTYTPATSSISKQYYYCVISLSGGGCSQITSNIATVNVAAQPAFTTDPLAYQKICVGGSIKTPLSVVTSGGAGVATYQWYSNSTNTYTGGQAIGGATSANFTPAAFGLAGDYYFYCVVNFSGISCNQITSPIAQVEVIADPIANITPSTQTICQGVTPTNITVTASGGIGTFVYQWYSNTTNSTAGATKLTGETSNTYIPSSATVGTKYYFCEITQTNGLNCNVTSPISIVNVLTGPTITKHPVGAAVCKDGNSISMSVDYKDGVGVATYQWYSNSTNSNVGGTAVIGETTNTILPPTGQIGTIYYYCVISFAEGGVASITSNAAPFTVNDLPSIIADPKTTQTVCVGGAIQDPLTVKHIGGAGTPSYKWYINTVNSTIGASLIPGANAISYLPPVFAVVDTFYIFCEVTMSGNGCGGVFSKAAEVQVIPDPLVEITPLTQTVCRGGTATTLKVKASGGMGIYTYQWYRNTLNNNSSGTVIPGATNDNYTPVTSSLGQLYYYCVVSQPNGIGCEGRSETAVVNVNPTPAFTSQPVPSTVCQGGSATQLSVSVVDGVGTPSYQWFSSTIDNNTVGSAIQNANAATYDPPTDVVGKKYYYCIVSYSAGSCANITSTTALVEVKNSAIVTVQPTPLQTICVGTSILNPLTVSFLGGEGTLSYQWYSNTSYSNAGGKAILGATGGSFTPPAYTSSGAYYYYCEITHSASGCGSVYSQVAEVLVVDDPTVQITPATQILCQNATPQTLAVTAAGGIKGAYAYQWYSNVLKDSINGTPINGATSSSFTPSTATLGTTYYYCVITQPMGPGCGVISSPSEVTVKAIPVFTSQPMSSEVCQGGAIPTLSVSYINGVGSPTYQWYKKDLLNPSGAAISGATTNSFDPSSANVGLFEYFCKISFPGTGCSEITSAIATIRVNPNVTITAQPLSLQSICVGGAIQDSLRTRIAGGLGTISYQWYSNTTPSKIGATLVPGATKSAFLPNVFTTIGKYYFYCDVTVSGNGCGAVNTDFAEVNVVEDPTVVIQPKSQNACQFGIATPIKAIAKGGVGQFTYQWYSNVANDPNPATSTLISGATDSTYVPAVTDLGTMYYFCDIHQLNGPGCHVISEAASVTVNLAPSFTSQPLSSAVCQDGVANVLTVSYKDGVGTPAYQWFVSIDNDNTKGTAIAGATNDTYAPLTDVVGTKYYYCIITLPTSGCAIVSDIATVKVAEKLAIQNQPSPIQYVCVGGSLTQPLSFTTKGGTGVASYQWYSNSWKSNVGGTPIIGAISPTYLPNAFGVVGEYYYFCEISYTGNGCGSVRTDVAEVRVVSDPIVAATASAPEMCHHAASQYIKATGTGGIGKFAYQWYVSTTNNNTTGTMITGANDSIYYPSTSNLGTLYYYCDMTQPNGIACHAITAPVEIKIIPGATLTVQPLPSDVCQGGTPNTLSVAYVDGTGVASYQWYSNIENNINTGTAIAGATDKDYVPSTSTVGSTYYYCILSLSGGGCANVVSETAKVTVYELPTVTTQPTPMQTLCIGGQLPTPLSVKYSGGLGAVNYRWFKNTVNSNVGGNPILGATNSTYTPPVYTIIGDFYYYCEISLAGTGCSSVTSDVATVSVVPDPEVLLMPSTQSVCQNGVPTDLKVSVDGGYGKIKYVWYKNSVKSNVGGTIIPNANDSILTPDVSTLSPGYYYCEVSQEGVSCAATSNVAEVLMKAAPVFTTHPESASVCKDSYTNALTVVYKNGAGTPYYQWYVSKKNDNYSGIAISGATTASYDVETDTVGTKYYYCKVRFADGSCSEITSDVAAITVTELPIITQQPVASQSICVGGQIQQPLEVNYSGGLGFASYRWYVNTVKSTAGATALSGATSNTYLPSSFGTAGNYYFYCVVSLSGSGCGYAVSDFAEVKVIPDPTIVVTPATQTLCKDAEATPLKASVIGGIGTPSFQWYSATTNNNSVGQEIVGATDSIYRPSTAVVGTLFYYCDVTQSGVACRSKSNTAEITVKPNPSFIIQPQSSEVCLNGNATRLTVSTTNGVGAPSYQWYSNIDNDATTGTTITGATNADYFPPTDKVGATYYYCVVSFANGGCSNITSEVAKVVVNGLPRIVDQTRGTLGICVGGSVADPLSVTVLDGIGTVSYKWYSNTVNQNSGGTEIPNTNAATYMPPAFGTVGHYYYYCVVSVSGNGCGTLVSSPVEVFVISDPTVIIQPTSQVVSFMGKPTDLEVTASGGVGSYAYQWYKATTNNSGSGSIIPGATNRTYTPLTNVVGKQYYYCVVSQPNGPGCVAISDIAEITVNSAPYITDHPASSIVCLNGAATTMTVKFKDGLGTPVYQWYSNIENSNTTGTAITGAKGASFDPNTSKIGVAYYYCIITFPQGGGVTLTSNVASVTVNSLPIITSNPIRLQNICVGGSIQDSLKVSYTDGVGEATYQWFMNNQPTINGGMAIPGANSASYMPGAFTLAGSYYFYCQVTLSGNGCGFVSSDYAEVKVVNEASVSITPLSQTVCNGAVADAIKVTGSGGVGTFAYQWYSNSKNSNTGGVKINNATNDTYTPSTFIVGTTYYYCELTQPTGAGCHATSQAVEVVVKPLPQIVTQPISSTVCEGGTPTQLSVTYSNGAGAPNYQWYSNSLNTTVGGLMIPGANSATYDPQNSMPGTSFYFCVISFNSGGCSNIVSDLAQVIIHPNPKIALKRDTICSGNAFNITPEYINGDVVPAGTTYTWSAPIISPISAVTGASANLSPQTSIGQTLINITNYPATVNYTVTPTSGDCVGQDFRVVVTVNPSIKVNAEVINSYCFGSNSGAIHAKITGGIPFATGKSYKTQWTGPNGFHATTDSIKDLAPGVYNMTVLDAGNCPTTKSYTVSELDEIQVSTSEKKDVSCYTAEDGRISLQVLGGSGAFTFDWTKDGKPFANTQNILNLGPGFYQVSVRDINGCGPKVESFTIVEPQLLQISLDAQTNVECFGATTGTIRVNVTGGTPFELQPGHFDYKYSWSGPNGFTSASKYITNIGAGLYRLSVVDNNGCSATQSFTVTETSEISAGAVLVPITCFGANNASITINPSGGKKPYKIKWSNLGSGMFQDNLAPGIISVTITDSLNCQKTESFNIVEAPGFTIRPSIRNVSCPGGKDGSIMLNYVGDNSLVKVEWSDGAITGTTRNNLAAGAYSVIVSNGTTCDQRQTFVVTQPFPIDITANIRNAFDCNNLNSGSIDITVTGGTPPYIYEWSNGATSQDIVDLIVGNYRVKVTDAIGCSNEADFVVTKSTPIALKMISAKGYDCDAKARFETLTAQISGGIAPYTINWRRGSKVISTADKVTTFDSGMIELEVIDAYGCSSSTVMNIEIPIFEAKYVNLGCYDYSFTAPDVPSSGTENSYLWEFGDGHSSNFKNPTHSYTTDGNYLVKLSITSGNCVTVFNLNISVDPIVHLIPSREPVFCTGDSVVIHATGAYRYVWSNGSTADSIIIKKKGEYSVIGYSKEGCSAVMSFKATNYASYNYQIYSDKELITDKDAILHVWSDNIPLSKYFWDFADGYKPEGREQFHEYKIFKEGYYDIGLEVITPEGCKERATKRIWIAKSSLVNTFTPNGDGVNDKFMEGWRIKVYNRNGVLLFEGYDGWDGTYNGSPVSKDTYFFVLYYTSDTGLKTRQGYVTVLR